MLLSSAIFANSFPCFEINALFGVITWILFFNAVSTTFFEIPSDKPIASNKISTFFLLKISKGFLKKFFLSILNCLFLLIFLAETATILIFLPVLSSISFFFSI